MDFDSIVDLFMILQGFEWMLIEFSLFFLDFVWMSMDAFWMLSLSFSKLLLCVFIVFFSSFRVSASSMLYHTIIKRVGPGTSSGNSVPNWPLGVAAPDCCGCLCSRVYVFWCYLMPWRSRDLLGVILNEFGIIHSFLNFSHFFSFWVAGVRGLQWAASYGLVLGRPRFWYQD